MWYNTGIETQRKGHLPMKKPVIHPTAFVAPNTTLRGDVSLAADSSVFYGAVLRGDTASITIGEGSNIQDNCVVHVDPGLPVTVGKNVTVGHGAILHGCTIGVPNGAKIGSHCLIGAGALVTQSTVIPDGMMALGSPARVKSPLTPEAIVSLRETALHYRQEAQELKEQENI